MCKLLSGSFVLSVFYVENEKKMRARFPYDSFAEAFRSASRYDVNEISEFTITSPEGKVLFVFRPNVCAMIL